MTDTKDIYFLTMDNISDYMGCDDKKLTDLELGKRVKLNLSLSQKNNVLDKKKLLLNNCLLTFKLFEQNIPAELIVAVYYELVKTQILYSLEEAQNSIFTLYEKYNLFSIDEKNKYSNTVIKALFLFAEKAYNIEQYEIFVDAVNKLEKIYTENDKNDEMNFYYAKSIALYGSLLFAIKQYEKAYSLIFNAYRIVELVSNDIKEKIETLAYLSFSLGNILFQVDVNDEAQKYFIKAINICNDYNFDSKFEIMHLAYNYLSQLQVCIKDYDEAIETINQYFKSTKDLFIGDDYNYICGEFNFRIGFIYNKFKNNQKLCHEYMNIAKNILDKIENKNDSVLNLLDRIEEYLK